MPILIDIAENYKLPDSLTRVGIGMLVGQTSKRLAAQPGAADRAFAKGFTDFPIALHTQAANDQHYELPAAFFGHVLGPRRKYSSCLYQTPSDTLEQAEIQALTETCAHADLHDGQRILELGCGWGSLSLWMAERYPHANIVSVSNSQSQKAYIDAQAKARGFANLTVRTADMNDFTMTETCDRVVSVEMFEHMANWQALLARVHGWLAPDGRAFIHVFAHRSAPYRFDHTDENDWIAKYFFTGGLMPSHGLMQHASDLFDVTAQWRWSGAHYQRTANHWLENFDRNLPAIRQILASVYGKQASVWERRWRLFFLATAGLFGYSNGEEWGVSHYLLAPKKRSE